MATTCAGLASNCNWCYWAPLLPRSSPTFASFYPSLPPSFSSLSPGCLSSLKHSCARVDMTLTLSGSTWPLCTLSEAVEVAGGESHGCHGLGQRRWRRCQKLARSHLLRAHPASAPSRVSPSQLASSLFASCRASAWISLARTLAPITVFFQYPLVRCWC